MAFELGVYPDGLSAMKESLLKFGGPMDRRQKNWKMPGLAALLAVVAMISTSACGYCVSIAPPTATVSSGQSQQFTASTQNGSGGDTFQWNLPSSCTAATCGTLLTSTGNCPPQTTCGPLTADGATITYVAPTAGSAPPTITLTVNAADNHNPPDKASATATITPIVVSVSVSPPTLSFQPGGASQPFTATVLVNGTPSTKGVTWSLSLTGADCTSATLPCGSLSSITPTTVSYAPPLPSVVGAAEQVVLTATPVEDTFITGSAVLSVTAATGTPSPVTVNVTPSAQSVAAGSSSTSLFTANLNGTGASEGVTWALSQGGAACSASACGSLPTTTSTTANYLPPTSVISSTTVTLTATAVAAPNPTAFATITITPAQTTPLTLSITPSAQTVSAGATSTTLFTSSLSGTGSSQGVTWALSQDGAACSASACGSLPTSTTTTANYLAPTSVSAASTVTLTAIAVAPPNPTASATITVNPAQAQGAFLRYVFEVGLTSISSYAVVPTTGQLRSLNFFMPSGLGSGITGPSPTAAIHPNGTVLYLVAPSFSNTTFWTMNLGLNGVLQQTASSPASFNVEFQNLAVDPLGQFLYASDSTDGAIAVIALDARGNPTGSPTTAVNVTSPTQMVTDSTGSHLFVLTSAGGLAMYSIDRTSGALTLVGTPATTGTTNSFLALTPNAQTLYVLSRTSIYAFSVASTTGLTAVAGSPFTGLLGESISAAQAAVDPSGNHLYVTAQDPDVVFGFSIASSGAITALSPASAAAGSTPNQINIDPTGNFVYVANQDDTWVYSLNRATGALTPVSLIRTKGFGSSAQLLSVGSNPLEFTPTSLYVANSASNNISQFGITASTGALNSPALQSVSPGTTPKAVALLPDEKFAYSANSGSGNLSAYGIAGGVLSPLGSPMTTGSGPSWLTSDLSGTFMYNVNQTDSTIWKFSIGDTGALTSGAEQVGTDSGPVFVTTDPTGQYLYTANSGAGNIDEFSILFPHGSLSLLNTTNSGGTGPDWIAVDPSGRYAYVANLTNGMLGEFTIVEGVGSLLAGPQPSVQVGTALSSVVVEPSGKYLFVSDSTQNKIFSYTIDSSTGSLTLDTNGGVSLAPGAAPVALAVDISGTYLYCGNSGTNDISVFTINLATGALTQVGTAAVKTGGTTPAGLATAGTIN